jgi:hypothetical protein
MYFEAEEERICKLNAMYLQSHPHVTIGKKKDRAALSTRAHQHFCRRGQPYIGVNSPLLHLVVNLVSCGGILNSFIFIVIEKLTRALTSFNIY